MDALGYGLAVGGDDFVVVLDLGTLIDEGLHGSFTALIDNDRSHLEDGLGIEIALGVCHLDDGVDGSVDNFEDLRFAGYFYVFGHFGHLLHGGAGSGGGDDGRSCKQFESSSHIHDFCMLS